MLARTMLVLVWMVALASSLAAKEQAPDTTERGTCIPGPHEPGRTIRLPGVAATSDRHLEAHEDAYLHCTEPWTATSSGKSGKGSGR